MVIGFFGCFGVGSLSYNIFDRCAIPVIDDFLLLIKDDRNQNTCLAFTVENIEKEYDRVLLLGVKIIEPLTKRPWGAVNMNFYDPDNDLIYFRQFHDGEV